MKNYHDVIEVDDDMYFLILKAFDQIVNFANNKLVKLYAYEFMLRMKTIICICLMTVRTTPGMQIYDTY